MKRCVNRMGRREGDSPFYKWVDGDKVVHYADSIEKIPEQFHDRAERPDLPPVGIVSGEFSRIDHLVALLKRKGFKIDAKTEKSALKGRPPAAAPSGKVIVYSTSWCPACNKAKEFISLLGVPWEERNVEKDPQYLAELVKLAGEDSVVPVIVIGGEVQKGFDPSAVQQAILALKKR